MSPKRPHALVPRAHGHASLHGKGGFGLLACRLGWEVILVAGEGGGGGELVREQSGSRRAAPPTLLRGAGGGCL